jgi:hypothetical protein
VAMSKREQAAFEAAIRAAKVAGALRWTEPLEPDLPRPGPGGPSFVRGWTFNPYLAINGPHSLQVQKSCSTANGHNTGSWDATTSQGGIAQYSTKLRAARALRAVLEKKFAETLADVDLLIEEAKAEEAAVASR